MLKVFSLSKLGQFLAVVTLGLSLGACDDVSDWGKSESSSSSQSSLSNAFKVSVRLSGLGKVGSAANSITFTNRGVDPITLTDSDNASTLSDSAKDRAFSITLPKGASYAVAISSPPKGYTCTPGSNAVSTATGIQSDVVVVVTCTQDVYTIGGNVTNLKGSVVLANRLSDGSVQTVTFGESGLTAPLSSNQSAGNVSFNFPEIPLFDTNGNAQTYNVTIQSQGPGLNCSLDNASGSLSVASPTSITNVTLTCNRSSYAVTANVSGLVSGKILGLTQTVATLPVSDTSRVQVLSVTANSAAAFASVKTGEYYAVTVSTQPVGQTCVVANGTGIIAAAVVSVDVTCTINTYAFGGTVTGLAAGKSLQLSNLVEPAITIVANGAYSFANVAHDTPYSVSVTADPLGQECLPLNGSTVESWPVNGVMTGPVAINIQCQIKTYQVGGTVTGLTSGTLVLNLNGGDALSLTTETSYLFPKSAAVPSGQPYTVSIAQQPTGAGAPLCLLINARGIVGGVEPQVNVVCSANTKTIGGTVTGLADGNTAVLVNVGGDDTPVSSNGSFQMTTPSPDGQSYDVTVLTQPTTQVCLVTNGSGPVSGSNITSVSVDCSNGTVGGTVTGLRAGAVLTISNNGTGTTPIEVTGTGSDVAFVLKPDAAAGYVNGTSYNVTTNNPQGQTCLLINNSGTIAGGNVTTVQVTCTTNSYTVGGQIILGQYPEALADLPEAGMGLKVQMTYTVGPEDVCAADTTVGQTPAGAVCTSIKELSAGEVLTDCADPITPTYVDPDTGLTVNTPSAKCLNWNFPDQIHFKDPLTQASVSTNLAAVGLACTLYNYNGTTYSNINANNGQQITNINTNVGAGNQNATNIVYYCVSTKYSITATVAGLPGSSATAFNPIKLKVVTVEPDSSTHTYQQQLTATGAVTFTAPTAWVADSATTRVFAVTNKLVYSGSNLYSVGVGGTCGSPGTVAPTVTSTEGTSVAVAATTTGLSSCAIVPTPSNGAYPYTPITAATYTYAGPYNAADYNVPYVHEAGTTFTASLELPWGYNSNKTGNLVVNLVDPSGKNPLHNTCVLTAPGASNVVTNADGSITGTILTGAPNITVTCTPYEVAITLPFVGYASGGTFTTQSTAKLTGTAGPNYGGTATCSNSLCETITLTSTGQGSGTATFTKYLAVGTPWSLEITQPTISIPRTCTLYNGSGVATTATINYAYANCTLVNPSDSFMFVANETNNTVTQFSFAPTTFTMTPNATVVTGQGTTAFNQPVAVAILPNGMNAYVLNKGNAKIYNFSVATKALGTTVGAATTNVGGQPFHMAMVPSGMGVYVTDNQGGVVYGYSVVGGQGQGQTAVLTTVPYYVTGSGAPNPVAGTTGSGPRGIAFHPNSLYAYVVNGNDNTVSQFSITGNGLSALGAMGTGGVTLNTHAVGSDPYYAAVDPSGRYLYVTNKGDNTISQFKICQVGDAVCTATTLVGGLTPMSPATVAVPATGPVAITASDTAVFVTTSDGKVAQFVIGSEGTLTSNANLNTGAIAAGTTPTAILTGFGTPFGQRVYVANKGSDSISSYLLDSTATVPLPLISAGIDVTTVPTGGSGPTGPTGFAVFK